jgi:hypothetical protein
MELPGSHPTPSYRGSARRVSPTFSSSIFSWMRILANFWIVWYCKHDIEGIIDIFDKPFKVLYIFSKFLRIV